MIQLNLTKYKEAFEDLIHQQNQSEKLLITASIIHELYQELLKGKKGYTDENFVVVGGLSLDYYTASNYITADIDIIIDKDNDRIFLETMNTLGFTKKGKDWYHNDLEIFVETPSPPFAGDYQKVSTYEIKEGYRVPIQAKEDIFLDRLRGVAHWNERSYLSQIRMLLEINDKFDFNYIEKSLVGDKETAIYTKLKSYFIDESIPSFDHIEYTKLFIDLKTNEIDFTDYPSHKTIILSDCVILKPEEYSKFTGYAYLSGFIGQAKLEFLVDEKTYYTNRSETGFILDDIYKIDDKPCDLKALLKILNNML